MSKPFNDVCDWVFFLKKTMISHFQTIMGKMVVVLQCAFLVHQTKRNLMSIYLINTGMMNG